MHDPELIEWLLDSDPALRWQAERDLVGLPEEEWQATRARVSIEGFGARLLAHQDPDGQWAGGAFFPADYDFHGSEPGQPWTATTWSLKFLREWGVEARVLEGTAEKLAENSRWEYEDLPYWGGEVDCCINSWTLSSGLWLGVDVEGLAQWFVEHRLEDGGWNCEWIEGDTRSSFHSTLNSLKGLLHYEVATGGTEATRAARHGGEEYLLTRHLFRRLSTGEVVGPWALRFGFPFYWRYSVLSAVDYFRAASLVDGTEPDARLAEAIEVIRAARQPDGRWIQDGRPPGRVWFDIDVEDGKPSKWLTFYALRALDWWDGSAKQS